jgi:uncharacterized membrane protein
MIKKYHWFFLTIFIIFIVFTTILKSRQGQTGQNEVGLFFTLGIRVLGSGIGALLITLTQFFFDSISPRRKKGC